jgi:hypothetical protein
VYPPEHNNNLAGRDDVKIIGTGARVLGRRWIKNALRICWAVSCSFPGLSAAQSPDPADAATASIRPEAIRAHMQFLASDLLEGRGTGSRGYRVAAEFVADQFAALGLRAAGDQGTFFQEVPLRSSKVDEPRSAFNLIHSSNTEALTFRQDYILSGDPGRTDVSVQAPIVFVGYGITAPDQKYDDYSHIDVKGKIVALLFGAPKFQSAVKAHYSASWLKRKNAADHGAAGVIVVYDPRLESLHPFAKAVRDLAIPHYNWLDSEGHPDHYYPALQMLGVVSLQGAEKLLAGSGHTAEEVYAAAKAGKLKSFKLAANAQVHIVTQHQEVHSPNVVAKLEGSDPSLKSQYVVYTAHLDHLGISTPVNGDGIYNGALDNASGVAEVLEIARAFTQMSTPPRRSILFVTVAAEEAGLLGSDYYASNPTVDKRSIVANVNIDEDVMLWPLQDVIAFGAEHSSLNSAVERAAQKLHLGNSPDPLPEQVAFVRSDPYSFVRQGVPALALFAGFKSDDPNINPEKLFTDWEQTRYHQPQDEMQQPGLNFDSAATFTKMGFLIGLYTAQDPDPPRWNPGDFFGITFAKGSRQ